MPRQPRLDAPGVLHHVIARGIEKTAIFRNDTDRQDFLARVAALRERGADASPGVQRIAHSIVYMTEHLDRPLRVAALAELKR